MRGRVKLTQTGKTACGIEIPAQVVAGLGPSRGPAVRATIVTPHLALRAPTPCWTHGGPEGSWGGEFVPGAAGGWGDTGSCFPIRHD
jgi:hypothetical protein